MAPHRKVPSPWSDQLQDKVEAAASVNWDLNLAEKCKGTGETTWHLPSAPFADESEFKAWADTLIEDKKDDAAKFTRLDLDPLQI